MNKQARTFDDKPATRERVPLLVGITGPSSSGKTFSALRVATGIQRVVGGDLFVLDTEAKRATHYADKFKFRHIDFKPPFGPLDYLAGIEHCIAKGARVIVIDSMTHEHSGEGGVMDQSEKWLDAKCGGDWAKRQKLMMTSLIEPKRQRKKLNSKIVQLGVNVVFCYRALDKIKPVSGGEPIKLGWQPETTSPLHYEMVQRFLLEPGSRGVPSLNPEHEAEKMMVKDPEQFRGWFKQGEPLSEELGERMARWAAGDSPNEAPSASASQPPPPNALPSFHWKSNGEWNGKPLRDGALNILREYLSTIDKALEKPANQSAATALKSWRGEVLAEIETAEAEEALSDGGSDDDRDDDQESAAE